MRTNDIEVGMKFYDESEGRYITVNNINNGSKTAHCDVVETEWDEETDTETEIEDTALFTLQELTHFEFKGWSE